MSRMFEKLKGRTIGGTVNVNANDRSGGSRQMAGLKRAPRHCCLEPFDPTCPHSLVCLHSCTNVHVKSVCVNGAPALQFWRNIAGLLFVSD
jgi:hypothetical protein